MNCQVPALTTGLRVTGCQAGSEVSTGVSCRYSCASGYSLGGPSSVTCGSDGTFSPGVPTCTGKEKKRTLESKQNKVCQLYKTMKSQEVKKRNF